MRGFVLAIGLLSAATALTVQGAEKTLFTPEDLLQERSVSEPAISPDGKWVSYVSSVADTAKDDYNADLWMASRDGSRNIRLTRTAEGESSPQWSPDGRYLAFLAARPADEADNDPLTQVWVLDREGGEAERLTSFPGDVSEFAWSPDGRRLAVIAWDADSRKTIDPDATVPPIVIDRYYFKEDYTGYVGPEHKFLYLFDVATRKADRLTSARKDESRPSWSPDGRQLAFLGRESADPDRDGRFTVFIAVPQPGAALRKLVEFQGDGGDAYWMVKPEWSPDGKRIAYIAGGDPKLIYYATFGPWVIDAAGGTPRKLLPDLDRNLMNPVWTPDGKRLQLLLEDDLNQQLVSVDVDGGKLRALTEGRREVLDFDLGRDGRSVVLQSTVDRPAEVFALEGSTLRPLSQQNDAWLATRVLATTEEIRVKSRDGTRISGFIVTPPGWKKGHAAPAVLKIHGGPVSQFANTWMGDWQALAAAGYVVIAANPRGSSGRGQAFSTAIYADWGNKDSEDVLAAVDHAVAEGIADPARLGVGGWSYGGILTNQVIARDGRFKAAVSGASISNALAGYGTDMYIREYEAELGKPWENPEAYMKVSYPFLNAGKITTPTLFLCGDRDFNVPLLNSEQMYQALKSRGVDTRLVIYPGQFHGIDIPSYVLDLMRRYLDWYGRFMPVSAPATD